MTTELFHHTTASGTEITLPKFKSVPAGVVRKLRKEDTVGFVFGVLEALAGEDALAAIDGLDMDEFTALTQAWQKDSGVTSGESGASSTS